MVSRLVGLLVAAAAWSAAAEEPAGTKLPVVTFGPLPVAGKIVVVQGWLGVPGNSSDRLKGPFAPDHPPFVKVGFGDGVSDQNGSDYLLCVYRIDEVERTLYPTIQPIIVWGSRICFATTFSKGMEEYPDNRSLAYLSEGLSRDGKYFVSGFFKITHPKLSNPDYDPHLVSASGPSKLREWVSTLTFREPWG